MSRTEVTWGSKSSMLDDLRYFGGEVTNRRLLTDFQIRRGSGAIASSWHPRIVYLSSLLYYLRLGYLTTRFDLMTRPCVGLGPTSYRGAG
jgi:hypothetical protein